ncbi:MAG: universal stress protein [Bacteroidota bacterium]
MKKLLVPYDFSPQADQALEMARILAQIDNAFIYVLFVIEKNQDFVFSGPSKDIEQEYFHQLLSVVDLNLRKKLERINQSEVKIEGLIQKGNLIRVILEQIEQKEIDLVVMATLGMEGWEEYVSDSRTERIVRQSPVPVLSLRNLPEHFKIRKIVYASDLHPEQIPAMQALEELKRKLGARLEILYVNTPGHFVSSEEIESRFRKIKQVLKWDSEQLKVVSAQFPKEGIISYTERNDVDLVALATHQRKGMGHLIFGSIAEDLVNHSQKPVITFGQTFLSPGI